MPIRMSGLVSNMDTDSIIKELMKAQSTKKTKVQNKITRTEWTQDKWKDLNTKIYALYTGSISKMKLQGSYSTKKVSSSDETKVTVTANTDAVLGSHSVKVNQLASSQYLTGEKISDITKDGTTSAVKSTTKLVDIDSSLAPSDSGETVITFKTKDKMATLAVNDKTTMKDFIDAAKAAGLTANYDENQKRIFISGSESGIDNYFEITTATMEGDTLDKKDALRELVGYEDMSSATQAGFDQAVDNFRKIKQELGNGSLTDAEKDVLNKKLEQAEDAVNTYVSNSKTAELKQDYLDESVSESTLAAYGIRSYQEVVDDATQKYYDSLGDKEEDYDKLIAAKEKALEAEAAKYANAVKKEFTSAASPSTNPYAEAIGNFAPALLTYAATDDLAQDAINEDGSGNRLSKLGISCVTATENADGSLDYKVAGSAQFVKASNSEIEYNGAKITGSTNSITANGLTFDVHGVTKGTANETITLTVGKDTQAVYDSIKEFVNEYNEVLKELNKLYNADTAKGYEPLTDEQRSSMTDDQIEKWETKIKDSLLRRDSTLGNLITTIKDSLMGAVQYEGKDYSLSSFGIGTYLYTEKGLLHIDGDKDDAATSGNADKLMKALEENPDAVLNTLSTLTGKLYDNLKDKMKSTTLSSALTFYNDKEIDKTLKQQKTSLKTLETKLKTMEDRYYTQFSKMETAMSKLNSQNNSLASFIG